MILHTDLISNMMPLKALDSILRPNASKGVLFNAKNYPEILKIFDIIKAGLKQNPEATISFTERNQDSNLWNITIT